MTTRDGNAAVAYCAKRGAFQLRRIPTRPVPVVSGWVIHMAWTFSGEMPGAASRAMIREFLTAVSERRDRWVVEYVGRLVFEPALTHPVAAPRLKAELGIPVSEMGVADEAVRVATGGQEL
jgi:hypothetical protein